VRELAPGLWHWEAPHPDWEPGEPWIAGDTLVDLGQGLRSNAWLREAVTQEQVVEGLRPLLALPVEHVLATHGGPTDKAALERALAPEE
jgi:hypothetical protein